MSNRELSTLAMHLGRACRTIRFFARMYAKKRRTGVRPFCLTWLEGRTARIPSSETMANEYIYGKDMGRAIDLAATVAMPPQKIFNIGNGAVTSFQDVL